MCGIAGIWNFNKKPISMNEIDLVTDSLSHRGPDGRGTWIDQNDCIALGHRRLSIIDLSENGKQPMHYGADRYCITFNGEIYNYIEIQNELESKGHKFRTKSDTEVILAAYAEWGVSMLQRLNGMWAFALYDSEKKKLLLSRDRYGVKPLYYYNQDNLLLFASEVQALHKVLGSAHPLNTDVMCDIANGSFVNHGSTQTYLKGVCSLPGGYNLHVQKDCCKVEEWYVLKNIEVPQKYSEQAQKFKELLVDSCKLRLRSDVPVGTCLSGGVDSGSITSLINKFSIEGTNSTSNYTHSSFCAAFPGSPINESESAKQLADTIGSHLHIVNIGPPSQDELFEAMRSCDGPMHALAFYPIWKLYKFIREKNVIVTLDGQGPDEMLGGYRPLYEALQAAIKLKKPGWFWDVYKTYGNQGETSQFSSKKFARKTALSVISHKIKDSISSKKDNVSKSIGAFNSVRLPLADSDPLNKSLFQQFFQAPLPGILNQYDRCSMANGIECRMPFMDYRIVEFVFSLPIESKVGGGFTKRILRSAMADILPDSIRLNKLKIGFNAPIVDWFKGPLNEWVLDSIKSKSFKECEYFNGQALETQFMKFVNDTKPKWNEAWQFWPPVHIVWWLSQLQKN